MISIVKLIKNILKREQEEVKNWGVTQEDIDKDLHLDELNNSLEGKCIGCFDTKIINKGTKVEEKCPICFK